MVPKPALAGLKQSNDFRPSMQDEPQEHLTTTEARAGATPHMTRYVLVFGTGLVILLFAIILLVSG